MSIEELQRLAQENKQSPEVQDARVVEFCGRHHLHIDLKNDDIVIFTIDGNGNAMQITVPSERS